MKRIILTLSIICTCLLSFAQKNDFPFEKKTTPIIEGQIVYSNIDTLEGADKSKIYELILSWIALNFKNSKSVVRLSNKESGKIIVKGNYRDDYKFKVLGSENPYYYTLSFTMDFTIKENKYRCIISDFIVNVEGGATWSLETLYDRVPDTYDFNKLGSTKRQELYRAKQILNNTDVFGKGTFLAIKKHVWTNGTKSQDDF